MGEPFTHRLRVRYSECDAQGVLFNGHYLTWIDHTVTEMWRAAYGGYQTMLDRGVDVVVAEARMRFLGPARFDEEVVLSAVITHMGTTSLTSTHRFRRVDGELLLDAEIRHVFVNRASGQKTPIPEWAREGLTPWFVPGTGAEAASEIDRHPELASQPGIAPRPD